MNMGTQGAPPIVAEAPMTFVNVKGEQFTFIKAASGVTIAVPPMRKRKAAAAATVKIRSRPQVVQYSRILIAALEEVVDYSPARHHNQRPPDLRIDDEGYLTEIRNLVAELRTLKCAFGKRRAASQKRRLMQS
jgi:hypothetical protein